MKYSTLIKRFQKYADEEVSMVAGEDEVYFFPVRDGNIIITHLVAENEVPNKVKEIKIKEK